MKAHVEVADHEDREDPEDPVCACVQGVEGEGQAVLRGDGDAVIVGGHDEPEGIDCEVLLTRENFSQPRYFSHQQL